jgi:hypothetical protein
MKYAENNERQQFFQQILSISSKGNIMFDRIMFSPLLLDVDRIKLASVVSPALSRTSS